MSEYVKKGSAAEWFENFTASLTKDKPRTQAQSEEYERGESRKEIVQKQSSIFNALDGLYHKILATVGKDTPTIENLKSYLKKAEDYTNIAIKTNDFLGEDKDLKDKLIQGAEKIGKVHGYLEKVENLASDIRSACKISKSIEVLNKWVAQQDRDGEDNKKAAAAFGELFGGVAIFSEKLPPPFNYYAALFTEISESKFFSRVSELIVSHDGSNSSTQFGRDLKRITDEDDALFKPNK